MGGIYPVGVVKKATSHYVDGFMFSPAFKARRWDGKRHFFRDKDSSFPIGLYEEVVKALQGANPKARITLNDQRVRPATADRGFDLHGIDFGVGKFDYQLEAAKEMVRVGRGILKIATNGGKTEIAAAVAKHLSVPTLFLVERLELVRQTLRRFAKRLQLPEDEIGYIADGEFRLGKWITIATPKSLKNRLADPEVQRMLRVWELVFADECHHTASDTFYDIMRRLPAFYRFGLSGTPLDRTDESDMRLIATTGPILYEVKNRMLIERGISVEPQLEMVRIKEPKLADSLTWGTVYRLGITENDVLAEAVVSRAVAHAAAGKQVVVLVDKAKHGKALEKRMKEDFDTPFKFRFISGSMKLDTREKALEDFTSRKLRCLIATPILDEGVDIPNIDVLILAAGGKSKIRLLQRVGRGLRVGEGKDVLHVIDFAVFSHRWLLSHSLERLRAYKSEDCFKISSA
jgi:superfamily II DNA or RNA helicase